MKGLITAFTLFLVALTISEVISQAEYEVHQLQEVNTEVAHGHRSKRSPHELLAPLLLGGSFLLGAHLGPRLFNRGHGWGPRHYVRSHGWGRPSRGWGWSSAPVVTYVSHGHGWH